MAGDVVGVVVVQVGQRVGEVADVGVAGPSSVPDGLVRRERLAVGKGGVALWHMLPSVGRSSEKIMSQSDSLVVPQCTSRRRRGPAEAKAAKPRATEMAAKEVFMVWFLFLVLLVKEGILFWMMEGKSSKQREVLAFKSFTVRLALSSNGGPLKLLRLCYAFMLGLYTWPQPSSVLLHRRLRLSASSQMPLGT